MTEQLVDEEALGGWLSANVEGFQGPFELTKFPSGQSNPTYRSRAASGDYVLRRKPFGKLLPSAHAVDREYRLLVGLHPLGREVRQDGFPDRVVHDGSVWLCRRVAARVHHERGRRDVGGVAEEDDSLRHL